MPGHSDILAAGEAALEAGDGPRALEATDRLLAAGDRRPAVWRLRAKAIAASGDRPAALAALHQAVAEHPRDAALHVDLGKALTIAGQDAAALAAYERALSLDPLQLEGWKGVLVFRPVAPDSAGLSDVAAVLHDTARSTRLRAKAGFVLGQILSEAGRHDAGFDHYAAANALMAADQQPSALEYRYPSGTFLDRAALLRHARPAPRGLCPSILIAGLPRSGKSLAETLVATAPQVRAGDELAVLARLGRKLDWSQDSDSVLAAFAAQDPSPIAQEYGGALSGAALVTDTAPTNLFRLGLLAIRHPDVPVVLCRRDPLALGASMFFKQFRRGNLFTTTLPTLGRAIARAERLMDHWQETLPNPLMLLDYRDTVTRTAATAGRLSALTGLALPAPPAPSAAAARLTPGRSLGRDGISDALLDFATPYARHFAPMIEAWRLERERRK
jgi:tetratricopeptide (TPR) repeat protein